jgi:uncharacterized membrane protein YkvA (DUF1232 family)
MTSQKADEAFVKEGAKKITDEDVEQVVNKAEAIKKKFSMGGPLARFVEDGQLLIAVVKDYWTGTYRQIPYYSIAAVVFSLAYVFNPFDLIPDVIPVVGEVDDALVVGACLLLVEEDLHNYKKWKIDNAEEKVISL